MTLQVEVPFSRYSPSTLGIVLVVSSPGNEAAELISNVALQQKEYLDIYTQLQGIFLT